MIHYCDALSDWDAIIQNGILDYALQLKKEGRIRHIGLSSHNPQVALKAVQIDIASVTKFLNLALAAGPEGTPAARPGRIHLTRVTQCGSILGAVKKCSGDMFIRRFAE